MIVPKKEMTNVPCVQLEKWEGAHLKNSFIVVMVGVLLWNIPVPVGLEPKTWQLFSIFVATVVGLILAPLPMGAVAILSATVCVITKTLTLDQALNKFASNTVWLAVLAFLIARGFIKTSLGDRLAYIFIRLLGKNTIGLGFGLVLTELLLAPVIPSNTARGAGITFPIIQSLALNFESHPNDESRKKLGAYLIQLGYHTNVVTSAMFLTAMAGNPLIANLAGAAGIRISWADWAQAAIVPGLITLILLPFVLYFIYPPKIKQTPHAPQDAKEKLKAMGPLTRAQKIMLSTFFVLLFLWIFGDKLAVDATVAAFFGLSIMIFSGVLTWDNILAEKGAWGTLVWFAIVLSLAEHLDKFGMMKWLGGHVQTNVVGFHWITALFIMIGFYYYIHYFFASMTAHVSAFFATFLVVMTGAGVNPKLAALCMAFASSLSAGLTHYGTGSAGAFFGSRFVTVKEWWRNGFILSLLHIMIWGTIGMAWWRFLGIY